MYDTHFDVTSYVINAYLPQVPDIGRASSPPPISPDFSLFTTIRFTSPHGTRPAPVIEKHHVPLVDRHLARLREAHAYFSERDGSDAWGRWPGDEHVWLELKTALESKERETTGDWRVSDCLVIRLVPGRGMLTARSGSFCTLDYGFRSKSFQQEQGIRRSSPILNGNSG